MFTFVVVAGQEVRGYIWGMRWLLGSIRQWRGWVMGLSLQWIEAWWECIDPCTPGKAFNQLMVLCGNCA